jgi:hypothetical protein
MGKVFVVQETPGKNVLGAGQFGELVRLLPPNQQIVFSAQPVVRKLRDMLKNFCDDDFLLAIGDPAAIGIACAVAAENNRGRFKMLKWDRHNMAYYPVQVDLYGKASD